VQWLLNYLLALSTNMRRPDARLNNFQGNVHVPENIKRVVSLKQWFSTTVPTAAYGSWSQSSFVRSFNKSLIFSATDFILLQNKRVNWLVVKSSLLRLSNKIISLDLASFSENHCCKEYEQGLMHPPCKALLLTTDPRSAKHRWLQIRQEPEKPSQI